MKRAEIKERLLAPKFGRFDAILLLAVLLLGGAVYLLRGTGAYDERGYYDVSQGYQAHYRDGSVYLLDSGHSRLTRTDTAGNIVYRIYPGLYIDGFQTTEDGGVILNGSLFDGMVIVGERVLRYDAQGALVREVAASDYGDDFIDKHAYHGASERDGVARYAVCRGNGIVARAVEFATGARTMTGYNYPNAFNAVSDAAFCGDRLYVLDRVGTLSWIEPGGSWTKIYDVAASGETKRVPYRITVDEAGEVYFTDIRSRTVQHVLPDGTSETVVEDTDAVTVDALRGEGGVQYTLTAGDTVWYPGGELTTMRNLPSHTAVFAFACLIAALLCPPALLLAFRVLAVEAQRRRSNLQKITLAVICATITVMILSGAILMTGFMDFYRDKINEELMMSAYATANLIHPYDVRNINVTGDYRSESYGRITAAMEGVFDRSLEVNRAAYCNILRYDKMTGEAYCVAYLDGSIGTYYPLDPFETAETIEVYETGKPVISDVIVDISGIYFGVKVPVTDDMGTVTGVVSVGTQIAVMRQLIRKMVVRVLTSVAILGVLAWIVASEVLGFWRNLDCYRSEKKERDDIFPGHLLRLLIVLIFAAYNLEATFLPNYIMRQLEGSANAQVLASLPYTVNIFLVGSTALLCAKTLRRFGPLRLLRWSMAFACAGNLLIFLIPGYASVMAGMALIGVGVGFVTNALYAVLTYVEDDVDQVWGLSIYNASIMGGVNLGMVGGSVLAVLLGQRAVFAVCALLWLVMLLGSGGIIRSMSKVIALPSDGEELEVGGLKALFGGREVPSFLVCIQNPYILFSAFAMYYVPIFCGERGYSETTVSLLLLCYAELSIYAGDSLTDLAQRRLGRDAMHLAIALNILALLVFALTRSLPGMMLALLILGLSASFGKPVQQKYFMDLPQVEAYGADRAMGVYNFTENIGESASPMILAWVLSRTPVFPAVAGFCGVVAALGLFHRMRLRGGAANADQERGI